jgi:hypothetical protein
VVIGRQSVLRTLVVSGLTVALLLGAAVASAAEVVARLDRTRIVEGETVTLILQTDDPAQSLEVGLEPLEPNFMLLDQRSETQMSIVDGQQTAVVRLMLTLEPRRVGELQIPALKYPGGRTRPLELSVSPAPELAPGEMPPVFIELSLEPAQGPYYVHAQMSLTVKIFYQQNLTEATINPPAPPQASVRLLDEVPFPAERNGTRYRVLQRRYAIFPERSGTLEIPPMRLTGRLIERSPDRLWQPSVRGRRVTEESEALQAEILPRPEQFTGEHWLPARELTMSQQLSDVEGLRVGEPVTRTLLIDAVGLEENMLEEPAWPAMENARIYPDQPQGISRDDGQWVRGHKEFRYAIVPEAAGELVLPEVRMEWWDTVADQPRSAVVPEFRVQVAPVELAPVAAARPDTAPEDVNAPQPNAAKGAFGPGGPFWRNLALLFAVLWLATLALLLWRGPARRPSRRGDKDVPADEGALVDRLKAACQRQDASRTRLLLRHWLIRYGPPGCGGSIVRFTASLEAGDLRSALEAFEACGYRAETSGTWDGRALWSAFARWHRAYARSPDSSRAPARPVPDLYESAAGTRT